MITQQFVAAAVAVVAVAEPIASDFAADADGVGGYYGGDTVD
jgi:hypothetical protein